MQALLLTCAAIVVCACWPAAAQDETTDAPDVATDQPPPATTPPPPPGINPNHSYYPPVYRPHFGGYYPNGYWNRYPSHGYPSRPWYYRPPAYHPPPTTYEWWRQFNRRPSFEHGGWNGGAHGGAGGYGYWPSSGSGYMQPYYTSSWWQPYYLAVGYYRRSSNPPSYGYNYPNYGGQNGGYGSSTGHPYVSGYDKFGYPYYRSGYYGGGLYGGQSAYGDYSRSYGCYPAGCGGYMPYYPYQGGYPYGGSSSGSYPYSTGYGNYPYYMSAHAGQPYYGGGSSYYGSGQGTYYGYGGGQAAYPSYSPGHYSTQGYGYSSGYPYYNYGSDYPSHGYRGYSTGKYSGSGSYPYGYFGSNYGHYSPDYQRYHYPGTVRGWYDCIYYPTAVNKGYAVSGSEGVKQKIDITKQSADKLRKTFTRRSIRELFKSSEDSNAETRRDNDRGPTFDLTDDGLSGGMITLTQDSAAKRDTPASLFQTAEKASSAKTEVLGLGPNDNDRRITAEMVQSFERRLTAMNRMFEELLTPKDMQENGDYFTRRVRTYRRLLSQMRRQHGAGLGPTSNDVDSQDMLRQLRAIENELDDHRRRALRTLYHALTDSDLTVSDKLKVLATVYDFAKGDLSEEGADISGSTERSVISSESGDASRPSRENDDAIADEDASQFYEKLEKFLDTMRNVEPSSSDEGAEDKSGSTALASKSSSDSSQSSSSESSSSEEAGSSDRAKFELKGSVSLAVDVEGKSALGSNSIGTLMKTMLS